MAGLPEVIGLLYRADWTRLSLSAEVRFEQDGDLARRRENAVRTESMRRMGFRPGSPGMPDVEQEPDAARDVYHRWHAALLIAPGRRYRLEYEGDHGGRADGSDGEQAWTLRPPDAAPLPPRGFEVVSGLPVPALFRPAGLLARFTLDVGGPVTACGREAIAVTAVPRHGAVGSGTSLRPPACDRVELIVDAETGILLRREETFEGQVLTLFELTTVTMSPPEADDPARFAPPAGSRPVRDPEDAPGRSGLGWQVAANAAGLAAGGPGSMSRRTRSATRRRKLTVTSGQPHTSAHPGGAGNRISPGSGPHLGWAYYSLVPPPLLIPGRTGGRMPMSAAGAGAARSSASFSRFTLAGIAIGVQPEFSSRGTYMGCSPAAGRCCARRRISETTTPGRSWSAD